MGSDAAGLGTGVQRPRHASGSVAEGYGDTGADSYGHTGGIPATTGPQMFQMGGAYASDPAWPSGMAYAAPPVAVWPNLSGPFASQVWSGQATVSGIAQSDGKADPVAQCGGGESKAGHAGRTPDPCQDEDATSDSPSCRICSGCQAHSQEGGGIAKSWDCASAIQACSSEGMQAEIPAPRAERSQSTNAEPPPGLSGGCPAEIRYDDDGTDLETEMEMQAEE